MAAGAARTALGATARALNTVLSFLVFSLLDVLDALLCVAYKLVDYVVEAEWRPCYCSPARDLVSGRADILVSDDAGGGSKLLRLRSRKLQLEDISDTLYSRPSLAAAAARDLRSRRAREPGTAFRINSTVVQMLEEKTGGRPSSPVPRWSDCDCKTCNSWSAPSGSRDALFVRAEGPRGDGLAVEDVVFIHGFISSSAFWTETVFPNLSSAARSAYRLLAVDLLGFGRSPKPTDSLYTLREHVDMIEKSVLARYDVKSFHVVAHSLGCIIALALAVKHPDSIKSLTLLAPPYFPVPEGEEGAEYVLRRLARRRVWPPLQFGVSVGCWYEHLSRTICLLICRNHRLWEFLFKLVTRNRIRTYMMEVFWCHTHNAAWHTLHNVICASAGRLDDYLDYVRDRLRCPLTVFHGTDDELLPVACTLAVAARVPRAKVRVVPAKDHITIVVGRQQTFARELEDIWNNAHRCALS